MDAPFSGRSLWLTSFWGFDPSLWGGVGFTDRADRAAFLRRAPAGSLLAIYVTRHRGPETMRGKLVGFLETTNEVWPMKDLTSPLEWAKAEQDAGRKGKWAHGVRASRAWEIVEEDWQDVEALFPKTYAAHNKQLIGAKGVPVVDAERDNILGLNVREVPVYGQGWLESTYIAPLKTILEPSKAIPPSQHPVMMREADGPKHLYILRLDGNYAHFLGREPEVLVDHHLIKVGFSKSPLNRCKQIQSAYPDCRFNWQVHWVHPAVGAEPYPNAAVAIAGEDAMKKRLAEEGESLGGEFFLVEDGLLFRIGSVGKFASDAKALELFPASRHDAALRGVRPDTA